MAKKKTNNQDTLHPMGKKFLWVEDPANIRQMIIGLTIVCALLFLGTLSLTVTGI